MLCPSSIQHQDSNPQPLEHESPPITTRPGLFLFIVVLFNQWHVTRHNLLAKKCLENGRV